MPHEDQIEFYSCPLCGRGIGNDIDGTDDLEHDCPPEKELKLLIPIEDAPRDGTEIIGVYENGEHVNMMWSENPVCMLGARNGSFPPGWATPRDGYTDGNLPLEEPKWWKKIN